jgi:hypothetical protein
MSIDTSKNIPMGLSSRIRRQKVWPRTFRFMLHSEKEELVNEVVKDVAVDFHKKMLITSLYDVDRKIYDWAEDLNHGKEDSLKLTTYDGCGEPLYDLKFDKVTGIGHKCQLDYSKSDVICHTVYLNYKTVKRTDHVDLSVPSQAPIS